VVQDGDTLAEIAEDYGVDLDLLAEVNAIENIDVIEVGQELIIPAP
jgi:LysM repeat protein